MPASWKTPPIEVPKLRDACEGRECYLQIPSYCLGGTETTVPCHSPFKEDNQGMSQKSHDILAVPGCRRCHDLLDNRMRILSLEMRAKYYHLALKRWWETLWREGIITVKGQK